MNNLPNSFYCGEKHSWEKDHYAKVNYKLKVYTYENAQTGSYFRITKDKKLDSEQQLIVRANQMFNN